MTAIAMIRPLTRPVFGTPATILPVDAVQELQIVSNFMPNSDEMQEHGQYCDKERTNTVHGSAIEYFRNDALDARNFFNPSSTPKAQFHNNQLEDRSWSIVRTKRFSFSIMKDKESGWGGDAGDGSHR